MYTILKCTEKSEFVRMSDCSLSPSSKDSAIDSLYIETDTLENDYITEHHIKSTEEIEYLINERAVQMVQGMDFKIFEI